jgi:hypothetical protein
LQSSLASAGVVVVVVFDGDGDGDVDGDVPALTLHAGRSGGGVPHSVRDDPVFLRDTGALRG